MTDEPVRALSEEAMLAALQDIRLPVDAPGGMIAELFAATGLGLVAAALLGGVAVALTVRRAGPRAPPDLATRIAALRDAPDGARVSGLLHLLKAHRPERFAVEAGALYRPGTPDPTRAEMLEEALLRDA